MGVRRIAILSAHTSPLARFGEKKTGGMNVYIRELARELGDRGIEVDIFTRRASVEDPEISGALGENVRVIHLNAGPPSPLRPDDIYPYLQQFTARLIAFATRHNMRYDIVYSHYWLSGWVANKLKETWGLPFVQMFHTLGHMKRRIVSGPMVMPDQRIMTETEIVHWADAIIAATPAEHAQLMWLYRAKRKKIMIVPPGVNTGRFHPLPKAEAKAQLGFSDDTNLLLFVGRIEPLKAVDTILEALHMIQNDHPALLEQLRFVVIGGDLTEPLDEEMLRLQKLRDELGLQDIAQFVGAKNQNVLPIYYAAATAVIMPSDYESFGMVALEAMAMGTPVIASEVGGLAYLVRDHETGFLVPVREPYSLAESITELLSNPQKTREMGEVAVQLAQEYAWSSIADRLLRIFNNIICGRSVNP